MTNYNSLGLPMDVIHNITQGEVSLVLGYLDLKDMSGFNEFNKVLKGAVAANQLEVVKAVIEKYPGSDVQNLLNNSGQSSILMVDYLLKQIKSDVELSGQKFCLAEVCTNLVYWSAHNNNYSVTEYLLENGADISVLLSDSSEHFVQHWAKTYLSYKSFGNLLSHKNKKTSLNKI